MKIVLTSLNSRFSHSSLAIRYLEKYCSEFNIETTEFSINDNPHSIYSSLIEKKADIYCFSCYIWNITQTNIVASMIKTALPDCTIVYGGPEAENEYSFVNYIIIGEGEQAFYNFLNARKNGIPSPRVISHNALLDLSKIAQPYDKDDIKKLEGKIIYYETSRGCPFACSYCLSSVQRNVRYFPMEYVKEGLRLLFENEVPLVKLVDRTFNCDKKRAAEIIEFIIENSKSTRVHLEIAPHLFDDETINLLASFPSLFQLEMGIQSTNPKTLKAINRDFDLEIAAQNIRKVKTAGINLHLDLIAGLPFEDYITFGRSFDFVYSLKPDMLQLGFLKILHGTPMESFNGIYYAKNPPYEVIYTDWINPYELCRLKDIENAVDKFYNSGAFKRTIKILTEKNPFSFFEKLADMLKNAEKNGSLPRYKLYNILYEFGGEKVAEPIALDFLQSNKDRPLPSFIKRSEPKNFKEFCYSYMKKNNLHLKNIRFEPIFDRIFLVDYIKNTITDL